MGTCTSVMGDGSSSRSADSIVRIRRDIIISVVGIADRIKGPPLIIAGGVLFDFASGRRVSASTPGLVPLHPPGCAGFPYPASSTLFVPSRYPQVHRPSESKDTSIDSRAATMANSCFREVGSDGTACSTHGSATGVHWFNFATLPLCIAPPSNRRLSAWRCR